MRLLRDLVVVGCSFGFTIGILSMTGGCSGSTPPAGSQVKVDEKEQADIQNKMKDYMAKKAQGGGSPAK